MSHHRLEVERAVAGQEERLVLPSRPAESEVTGGPRLEVTSRPLTLEDLEAAEQLYLSSPGDAKNAAEFRKDAEYYISTPPSAVMGLFSPNQELLAVGCIERARWDNAYWHITWVLVDSNLRGGGSGNRGYEGDARLCTGGPKQGAKS